MKKRILFKTITDYIVDNKWKFFIITSCLVSGVVIGSLSAIFLKGADFSVLGTYMNNFVSAHTLQTADRGAVFGFSVYNNIKTILFMWVSGFWIALIPIGFLQVFSKGYRIGFTSAFLVQLYGGKGILFLFSALLPQIIIVLPIIMVYSVFNVNFAFILRHVRQKGQSALERKDLLIKNLIFLILVTFILVLSSLIDAYVVPPILKPICSFVTK